MSTGHRFVVAMGFVLSSGCSSTNQIEDVGDSPAELSEATQAVDAPAALTLDDRIRRCKSDPRVVAKAVNVDICVGADLFFRETFGGNGRSCATCHRVDRNMTIDAEFISHLPPNDPLFVAEFNSNLAKLEIPEQMRARGLILENVDGFSDPTERFVLRAVPHTLSLATSVTRASDDPVDPPVERTGWSGDGAPGNGGLRDFQTGAITQHYTNSLGRVVGTDFRLATDGELDRIELFMRQFGRRDDLALTSVVMSDAGAEAGRTTFLAVGCNACHGNAGANASFGTGGNRNFNTGVESSRNPALAGFPHDGGFGASQVNADGSIGDGTFNVPPLVEAADTGPFFHTDVTISGASAHNTDSATTIEEAIAFYDSPAFNQSPAGQIVPINLSETDIDNIGRFLRGLNATFNAAMASKRLDAASLLVGRFHNNKLAMQREMQRLAGVEVTDAIDVLGGVADLDGDALGDLYSARANIELARTSGSEATRSKAIADAHDELAAAAAKVGTNLTYRIGDASVMF